MTPYYDHDGVTIYHGDCREVLPQLGVFDLLLTDPPYGIGVTRMQLGPRAAKPLYRGGDWDDVPVDLTFLLGRCPAEVIWGGNHFRLPPARGWLVWDKRNGTTSFADCELAWSSLDMPCRKYERQWIGAHAKERAEDDRWHPTQKPVDLMAWCIGLAGDVQTVLDPFAGSGTTGLAARKLGKRATLIEMDERYCEITATRLQQRELFGVA